MIVESVDACIEFRCRDLLLLPKNQSIYYYIGSVYPYASLSFAGSLAL